MTETQSLMRQIADLDQQLAAFGAVEIHERDGLLLKRRALISRLHAAQEREARRPALRVIEGGWSRTLGIHDVA